MSKDDTQSLQDKISTDYQANPVENSHSMIERIERDLVLQISVIAEISEEDIDTNVNIHDYGLDSFKLVQLASSLINYFDIEIAPTIFYGYTTIEELSQYYLEEYEDVLKDFYKEDNTSSLIT